MVAARVLLLVPVAAIVAGAAHGAGPAQTELIAFSTDRAPNLHSVQPYALNIAGRGRHALGPPAPEAETLVRSPNGDLIAYVPSDAGELLIRPTRGGPARPITSVDLRVEPSLGLAFSADGRKIAFVAFCRPEACGVGLYVADVDGRRLRRVAEGVTPTWAPNSRTMAYASPETGESRPSIFAVAADGSRNRRLATGSAPAWAPRGSRLAFLGDSLAQSAGPLRVLDLARKTAKTLIATPVQTPLWSPNAQRIAFRRGGSLAVVDAAGGGLRRLTERSPRADPDIPVAWSPGSKRIAFLRGSGGGALYRVSAAGGRASRVTHEPRSTLFSDVRWRPAETITFGAYLAGNDEEIAVTDSSGNDIRVLTANSVYDRTPAWSPQGSVLAFSHDGSLHTMSADGREIRRLTSPPRSEFDQYPTWSPDGSRLAFIRDGPSAAALLEIVNADGTGLKRVPVQYVIRTAISWSPDGTRIAFTSLGNARVWQVFTVRQDGTDLRQVTDHAWSTSPAWSPDGSRIVYENLSHLYVLDVASGADNRIASDVVGPASWSPDGTRVVFAQGRYGQNLELVVANADGTDQRAITDTFGSNFEPSWRHVPETSSRSPIRRGLTSRRDAR
jgi:Tol biopolymer transport system component